MKLFFVLLVVAVSTKAAVINRMMVVDPVSDESVMELKEGSVVNLFEVPDFNVLAVTGSTVRSMRFVLSGPVERVTTENAYPWALFGDKSGNFFKGRLTPGDYTLKAIAFAEKGGNMPITDGVEIINFVVEESICFGGRGDETSTLLNFPRGQRLSELPAPLESASNWTLDFQDAQKQPRKAVVERAALDSTRPLELAESEFGSNLDDDAFWKEVSKVARRSRRTHIKVPKKVYHLDQKVYMAYLNDVVVDGQGATLTFSNPYDGGVVLRYSQRVSFINFKIRFETKLFSLARITKDNGLAFLDPEENVDGNRKIGFVSTYEDDDAWGYKENSDYKDFYPPGGATVNDPRIDMRDYVGRKVLVRYYKYEKPLIFSRDCDNMHFENLQLSNGPGIGVLTQRGKGFYFSRVHVGRDCGAPVSLSADAFHAVGISDVIIDNCDFSYQGDDSINIHTKILPAHTIDDKTLQFDGPANLDWHFSATLYKRNDGDQRNRKVNYFNGKMRPMGQGAIESVDFDSQRIFLKGNAPRWTKFVIIDDTTPRNVVVQNTYIHHHRARGVLVQGDAVAIQNNHFDHVSMCSVWIDPDVYYWNEGVGLNNAIIKNNIFSKTNAALTREASVRVKKMRLDKGVTQDGFIRDLDLKDNLFEDIYSGIDVIIEEGQIIS